MNVLAKDVALATRLHDAIGKILASKRDGMEKFDLLSQLYYGLPAPDRIYARDLMMLRLAGVSIDTSQLGNDDERRD